MAAHSLPLSPEDFHKLYDDAKPAYEYWYGTAVQKPMPTALHGIVQAILILLFERAGWNAASEVRLKVVPEIEPVPDLIAVRGKIKGRYPVQAPPLCIEILSPRDKLCKALEKARTYLSWGTEAVWIIDPGQRTAWNLKQDAAEPEWIAPDDALRIDETAIPLTEIFAEVDKKLEADEE